MARYMIAPLDLTIEELNIYQLIYKKVDFNSWVSDYTLDQLSTDSHQALNISKKVASRIVNKLIELEYLEIVRVGVKGRATLYKINRDKLWNESGTNRERIGNESGMNNEPLPTLSDIQRNELGTNKERIGNELVTPIKEKEKEIENKESSMVSAVIEFYDSLDNIPKYRSITDSRRKSINARIKEHSIDTVKEVVKLANESKFLNDSIKDTKWYNFDWIFNPTNFVKILEGKYNKEDKQHSTLKGLVSATANPTRRVEEWK
jgi:hypothetical protein